MRIKLGVEVTPCHKIRECERHVLPEAIKTADYLPPMVIRLGWVSGLPSKRALLRYVSINNYFFHILILQRSMPDEEYRVTMKYFSSALPGVTFLAPNAKAVTIGVSSRSSLDTCKDTYTALLGKWAEFEKEAGNKQQHE
jgi:hypothetical protein